MAARAEEFFKQIVAAGDGAVLFIRQLVSDQKPESDYLEFKNGKIQSDDARLKETWSETLSAPPRFRPRSRVGPFLRRIVDNGSVYTNAISMRCEEWTYTANQLGYRYDHPTVCQQFPLPGEFQGGVRFICGFVWAKWRGQEFSV